MQREVLGLVRVVMLVTPISSLLGATVSARAEVSKLSIGLALSRL